MKKKKVAIQDRVVNETSPEDEGEDYGDESPSRGMMGDSYGVEGESYSRSNANNANPFPKQRENGHLEDRLEQIKQNIKSQKQSESYNSSNKN